MKIRRIICLLVALTMVFSMTTITADAASFKSKPTGVKAKCVNGASVKVSCKAKSGATGYNFYYNTKKGGTYKLGATSTSRTAVVKGLTAGKKYYFKVQAYRGTTVKTYSKMSKAVKCKTKLKTPTVKVIDKCGCGAYLKMSCQEGTKGFAVYRSTKKKKGFKKIKTVKSGAAITWKNEGLKASTTYYYKVKAVSGKYSTKYSKVVAVKTDAWHRNGNDAMFNPTSSLGKSYKRINGGKNKLTGRNILFLGSSITYGSATGGIAFPDYIRERNNANVKKLSVSGTTMARPSVKSSYVYRLKNWNAGSYCPDIVACQLSLNDSLSKNNVQLGKLPDINFSTLTDSDIATLYKNSGTVGGAIGFINAYAHKKWPYCKVVFYTVRNSGHNSKYADMRNMLFSAKKKYGNFEIIDMWSMSSVTNLKGNNYCMYMADANHPKKAGYLYQWTPVFESKLIAWMPDLYTVNWVDEDGKVLETDKNVRRYTPLSYNGAEPTKAGYTDEQGVHTFTFEGWKNKADGEGGIVYTAEQIKTMKVTGNMTFVAKFKEDIPPVEEPVLEPEDPPDDNSVNNDGNSVNPENSNQENPNQDGQPAPDSNSDDPDSVPDEAPDNASDITSVIQSLLRAA